jgi:hypothetical protein
MTATTTKPIDVVSLLRAVRLAGRDITSDGTKLTITPGPKLPDGLLEAVKRHREELVALLVVDVVQDDLVPSVLEVSCFPHGTELSPADASPLVAKAIAVFGGRPRLLSDDEFRSLGFRSRAERADGLTPQLKCMSHPIPTSATTKEGTR